MLITEQGKKISKKYQQISSLDFDMIMFYKNIKKYKQKHFCIVCNNAKAFFKFIRKKLTVLKAAGGLVENNKGEYLFIYRNKKWDLPKGKLEKGEKMKQAAVREVEEECGIKISERDALICKTYHIYEMADEVVLKHTNWYKMKVKGSVKLAPQVAEGIMRAVWVSPEEMRSKMKNTYPLIKEVIAKNKE